MSIPRGVRNCNPGNIREDGVRWKGEIRPSADPAFKQFRSMAWGYRAMFVTLNTYRRRYGLNTLRSMIHRWAPPSENDTAVYVKYVAAHSGIAPDAELDTLRPESMCPLVAAMSRMENGRPADPDQVRQGWELFEKHRS